MKRPALTAQVFLAVLVTATLVALGIGAAVPWSFNRGFIGFLNEQAVRRMEAALPRLQDAYAKQGSWDFVRDRPSVWFGLLGSVPVTAGASEVTAGAEITTPDLLGAGRRLTLLDSQRQRVIGFPTILADSVQREIVVGGRTVGWLAIAPIQTLTEPAALHFLQSQLHATLLIVALALVLAALVAWRVTRQVLAPVRAVAQATHRLAAGAYDTRVAVRGHDEIAQLAQDFNQLALKLERNEQSRRDYMADISHELRTPLAVLRGELEAMEDGIHPATPQALRLLRAEVATLSQLVGDLHELALADVGALTYRKADLDLDALLEQDLVLLRHACDEHGLTLHVVRPASPLPLLGDEARLRQLLRNVLGNAVRHTDGGGRIEVALREDGDQAVIDVQDSPPGAPPELLPRLFDRFFRLDSSRARASGGSGLGLAISAHIVQAHGGRIEARPSPLGGVWIEIRLPLARSAPVSTR